MTRLFRFVFRPVAAGTALCLLVLVAHGQLLEVVYRFGPNPGLSFPGFNPYAPLIQGSDGSLYGSTESGGRGSYGTLFKFTTDREFTQLVHALNTDGRYPKGALVEGFDGQLYGVMANSTEPTYGMTFRMSPTGGVTTLSVFHGTNGAYPQSGLLRSTNGDFYGTTKFGGPKFPTGEDVGTVFRMTSNGVLSSIGTFDRTNGAYPEGRLTWGPDGMLYGTAVNGGPLDYGTIYRIATNGNLTRIAYFDGTNGAYPFGELTLGRDNAFYGTAYGGGVVLSNAVAHGTIFRVTLDGVLTRLAYFNYTNGAFPSAGLVEGSDGAYYGVTVAGGTAPNPNGTFYRVTTNGVLTPLISFGQNDPREARATLIRTLDGDFYGTSAYGNGAYGTIFRLSTLHLHIAPSSSTSVLSWLTNGAGFRVQFATNLNPPVLWRNKSNTIQQSGARFYMTNPASMGAEFYRLVKP